MDTHVVHISSVHVGTPMSHRTSLAKHKFKGKIKNFKTAVRGVIPWSNAHEVPELRSGLCMVF